MCGRFTYLYKWREIHRLLSLGDVAYQAELPLRYNVAPTQDAPVVLQYADGARGGRELRMFRWGLVPWWAKDESGAGRMINARAESVATRPAFREAFQRRRCLVPVSGFYEWQKLHDGPCKQPWYISMPHAEPFCLAGLWERWRPRLASNTNTGADTTTNPAADLHTFTIITTAANPFMRPLHDRMPVIVPPTAYETWLNPTTPPNELLPLLTIPEDPPLKAHPVSTRINSPTTDDPSCINPVDPATPLSPAPPPPPEPTLFG